jgi:hypothetical protein
MRAMRRPRRLGRYVFAVAASSLPLLAACSFTVPRLDPAPNTALVAPDPPHALALTFAPGVPDLFVRHMGDYTMTVESWHESLDNAFRNGFRKAYPAAKAGTSPDLVLQIDRAELELGDFDHARDVDHGDRMQARIQVAATLTARDGTQRRTSGVASRGATMYGGSTAFTADLLDEDVTASIDAMFEQIARELFTEPKVRPATCVPGQSIACVGPKACQGFQVCAGDGSRFGACACSE